MLRAVLAALEPARWRTRSGIQFGMEKRSSVPSSILTTPAPEVMLANGKPSSHD